MRARCPCCLKITRVDMELLDYLLRCDMCYSFLRLRPARVVEGKPASYRIDALPRPLIHLPRWPSGLFDGAMAVAPPVAARVAPSIPAVSSAPRLAPRRRVLSRVFGWASAGAAVVLLAVAAGTLVLNMSEMLPRTRAALASAEPAHNSAHPLNTVKHETAPAH